MIPERMLKFLDSWDWEDTAFLFFWVAVTVMAAVGLTAICADHRTRYYYVQGSVSSCVMADINWETDDAVFCSADIDKVLAVAKTLNEELKLSGSR